MSANKINGNNFCSPVNGFGNWQQMVQFSNFDPSTNQVDYRMIHNQPYCASPNPTTDGSGKITLVPVQGSATQFTFSPDSWFAGVYDSTKNSISNVEWIGGVQNGSTWGACKNFDYCQM